MKDNPYTVVVTSPKGLTGHNHSVLDTRTGETLGSNLSKLAAAAIAAEVWADECGEDTSAED